LHGAHRAALFQSIYGRSASISPIAMAVKAS
jgi:hypothetical protein